MATTKETLLRDNPLSTMFSSLEEEKAFYARKAEQFKSRLTSQVDEFKTEYGDKARTGLIVGGAVLGATVLMRLLTGTKKKWVESDQGPVKIRKTESILWSLAKGAAVVGIGYLVKDPVIDYIGEYISPSTQPKNDAGSSPTDTAEPLTEL